MNKFERQNTRERQIRKLREQAKQAPNHEIYGNYEGSGEGRDTIFEN